MADKDPYAELRARLDELQKPKKRSPSTTLRERSKEILGDQPTDKWNILPSGTSVDETGKLIPPQIKLDSEGKLLETGTTPEGSPKLSIGDIRYLPETKEAPKEQITPTLTPEEINIKNLNDLVKINPIDVTKRIPQAYNEADIVAKTEDAKKEMVKNSIMPHTMKRLKESGKLTGDPELDNQLIASEFEKDKQKVGFQLGEGIPEGQKELTTDQKALIGVHNFLGNTGIKGFDLNMVPAGQTLTGLLHPIFKDFQTLVDSPKQKKPGRELLDSVRGLGGLFINTLPGMMGINATSPAMQEVGGDIAEQMGSKRETGEYIAGLSQMAYFGPKVVVAALGSELLQDVALKLVQDTPLDETDRERIADVAGQLGFFGILGASHKFGKQFKDFFKTTLDEHKKDIKDLLVGGDSESIKAGMTDNFWTRYFGLRDQTYNYLKDRLDRLPANDPERKVLEKSIAKHFPEKTSAQDISRKDTKTAEEKPIKGYLSEFTEKTAESSTSDSAKTEKPATIPEKQTETPSGAPFDSAKGLRPAIEHGKEVTAGKTGDNHITILDRESLAETQSTQRGFVTPDNKFLSRSEAIAWIKENQPELAKKLGNIKELHSEELNKALGLPELKKVATESTEKKPAKKEKVVSSLTAEDKKKTESALDELLKGEKTAESSSGVTTASTDRKVKQATNFERMKIKDIKKDLKNYQGRVGEDYSEQTFNRIVNDVKEGTLITLPAIVVYERKNGDRELLAGHSRLATFEYLNKNGMTHKSYGDFSEIDTQIIRESDGITPEQAKRFALESNQGAVQTNASNASYLRKLRLDEDLDGKKLQERAKDLYGNNGPYTAELTFLNPSGKLFKALKDFKNLEKTERDKIERIASYVGNVRMKIPDISNAHENEMFDYLMNEKNFVNFNTKTKFNDRISKIVDAFDFDAGEPLNLESKVTKSDAEREYEKKLRGLETELRSAEQELADRGVELRGEQKKDPKISDKQIDDILNKKRDAIKLIQKDIIEHRKTLPGIMDADKQQQKLFETPEIYGKAIKYGLITSALLSPKVIDNITSEFEFPAKKEVIETKLPDKLKITDDRKIDVSTGNKITDKNNFSGSYDTDIIKDVVSVAVKNNIDPYTFVAMALQESTLGKATGGRFLWIGDFPDEKGKTGIEGFDFDFSNIEKSKKVQPILDANKDKEFVQRILSPNDYPRLELTDDEGKTEKAIGDYATHQMAWSEVDDKYVVYPTIIYDEPTKSLKKLDSKDAINYALKNNEYISFDNSKEADWFSKNYKAVWDIQKLNDLPEDYRKFIENYREFDLFNSDSMPDFQSLDYFNKNFKGLSDSEIRKKIIQIHADYFKEKMKYAKNLGYDKTEAQMLQSWNGYPNQKFIQNAPYGKRVIDIKDNVIKKNSKLVELIKSESVKKSIYYDGKQLFQEPMEYGRDVPHTTESMAEIVKHFASLGTYGIDDIARELKNRVGEEEFKNYIPVIKAGYEKFRDEYDLSPAIKNNLDDEKTVRKASFDSAQDEEGKKVELPGGRTVAGSDRGKSDVKRPPLRYAHEKYIPTDFKERVLKDKYVDAKGNPALDEHQRFGVNLALEYLYGASAPLSTGGNKAFGLFDDTGVGKTREILAIANESLRETNLPVIIITQNQSVINDSYKRDAKAMQLGLSKFGIHPYSELVSGKVNMEDHYGLVIYDEAQNLKNLPAQKTQQSLKIDADKIVYATATPFDTPKAAVFSVANILGMDINEVADKMGVEFAKDENDKDIIQGKMGISETDVIKNILDLRDEMIEKGAAIRREYPFFGKIDTKQWKGDTEYYYRQKKIWDYYDKKIYNLRYADLSEVVKSRIARAYGQKRAGELWRLTEVQKVQPIFDDSMKDIKAGKLPIIVGEFINTNKIPSMGIEIPGFINEMVKKLESEGLNVGKLYGADRKAKDKVVKDIAEGKFDVVVTTTKSGLVGVNLDDIIGDRPRVMHYASVPHSGDMVHQGFGRVSRRNTLTPSEIFTHFIDDSVNDERRKIIVQSKMRVAKAIQEGVDIDLARLHEGEKKLAEGETQKLFEGAEKYGTSPKPPSKGEFSDTFYSQLERVADTKVSNNANPDQILKTLLNNGVKQEELDWMGLKEWLSDKPKVNKNELMDFIRGNSLQVEEKTLSENVNLEGYKKYYKELQKKYKIYSFVPEQETELLENAITPEERKKLDSFAEEKGNIPKFAQWQLPGGKNYREMLFKLPNESQNLDERIATLQAEGRKLEIGSDEYKDIQSQITVLQRQEKEIRRDEFTGGHFDEPNIFAHTRLNDRTLPNGKKMLFIEEIQSDWHQAGRKQGYAVKKFAVKSGLGQVVLKMGGNGNAVYDTKEEAQKRINDSGEGAKGWYIDEVSQGVPDAPFKKTWHEFVIKRLLRHAAENGYDSIGWTTGEQQAERYDLSKHIDTVGWSEYKGKYSFTATKDGNEVIDKNGLDPSQLEEYIGKEVAQKIINGEGYISSASTGMKMGELANQDLKVGGEGMKGFYDKIIPDFVNKYTKKWGGKVGEESLSSPKEYDSKEGKIADFTAKVHSLTLTPEMKESVLYQGQPLFQKTMAYGKELMDETMAEKEIGDRIGYLTNLENYRDQLLELPPSSKRSEALLQVLDRIEKVKNLPARTTAPEVTGQLELLKPQIDKILKDIPDEKAKKQTKEAIEQLGLFEDKVSRRDAEGGESPSTPLRTTEDNRSTGEIRGLGFTRALINKKKVSFLNYPIKTPKDLAMVTQVMRNPLYETFTMFYLKDGVIVGHESISSRIPNSTVMFDDSMEKLKQNVQNKIKQLGATEVYAHHNHPSGVAQPSGNDISATKDLAKGIPEFKGHVVINSGEYGWIRNSGAYQVDKLEVGEDKLLKPEINHPLLGTQVKNSRTLAEVTKQVQMDKNMVVIFYLTPEYKIRAIQTEHNGIFDKADRAVKFLEARGKEFGSSFISVGSSEVMSEPKMNIINNLIKADKILDYNDPENWGMRLKQPDNEGLFKGVEAPVVKESQYKEALKLFEEPAKYGEGDDALELIALYHYQKGLRGEKWENAVKNDLEPLMGSPLSRGLLTGMYETVRGKFKDDIRTRSFARQIITDEDTNPEVINRMGGVSEYEVKHNEELRTQAMDYLKERGEKGVIMDLSDPTSADITPDILNTAGMILTKKLTVDADKLKEVGDTEGSDEKIIQLMDLYDKLQVAGTLGGRGIQAFAQFHRLTPEGALKWAEKEIKKANGSEQKNAEKTIDQIREIIDKINAEATGKVLLLSNEQIETLARKIAEEHREVPGLDVTGKPETSESSSGETSEGTVTGTPEGISTGVGGPGYEGMDEATRKKYEEEKKSEALDDAARKLANKIRTEPPKKAETDPVMYMVNTLFQVAKENELIPEHEKPEPEALIKLIGDAVKEEKTDKNYTDVWEKAQDIVKKRYANDQNSLETLDQYFEHFLENPFSQKQVERVIRKGAKEIGAVIKDVVKQHFSVADKLGNDLADKLMTEAGLTPEEGENLSKSMVKIYTKLTTEAKDSALKQIFKKPIIPLAGKTKSLIQKIIEQSNLGAPTNAKYKELFRERYKMRTLTVENGKTIIDLANKVQETPEGFQREEQKIKLMNYIKDLGPTSWKDIGMSLWFSSILSGLTTQAKIARYNLENMFLELGVMGVIHPREFPSKLAGLIVGMGKGIREAGAILSKGDMNPIAGKQPFVGVLERKTFKGGKINPFNYAKYVTRLLAAEHKFFLFGWKESEQWGLAHELARKEKIEGKSLTARMMDILHGSDADVVAAKLQAQREGLKGNDLQRRVFEIMEQHRPKEMVEESVKQAIHGTLLYDEPKGVLGNFYRSVKLFHKGPGGTWGRMVVPFMKIATNLTNNKLEWTPWGYKRAFWGYTGEKDYNWKQDTKDFQRRMLRATFGTMATLTLGAIVLGQGDDDDGKSFTITAMGTGDYKKNNQLMETGWRPYTFRWKGKYYSYLNSPLALTFTTIGYLRDFQVYQKKKVEDAGFLEQAGMGFAMTIGSMMHMEIMQGLTELLDALDPNSPAKMDKYVKNFVLGRVGDIVPNIVKQVGKVYNNKVYDANSLEEIILKNTGAAQWLDGAGLKPKLNVLGEEINTDKPLMDLVKDAPEHDPVWDVIVKNGAYIPIPSKNETVYDRVMGKQRTMIPEEYYEFVRVRGGLIKQNIETNLDKYNKMTSDEVKLSLKKYEVIASELAKEEATGIKTLKEIKYDFDIEHQKMDINEIFAKANVRNINGKPYTYRPDDDEIQAKKIDKGRILDLLTNRKDVWAEAYGDKKVTKDEYSRAIQSINNAIREIKKVQ